MNWFQRRRRAMMNREPVSQLVDTSATAAAFYIRKRSAESHICGARESGKIKLWRDTNTTSGDFSLAAYTSSGLNSTNFSSPWADSAASKRCKFGGDNSSPATTPTKVNLDNAYAYWQETGRIMFAGVNTPFYGMANIDGTLAAPGWTG